MPTFDPMDYAEVEELWKAQRVRADSAEAQLGGMELGVPVRFVTRADISKPQGRAGTITRVRKAMKNLGYDDWREVMVIFHEGRVVVCRPFGQMPVRKAAGPTLREVGRSEVVSA